MKIRKAIYILATAFLGAVASPAQAPEKPRWEHVEAPAPSAELSRGEAANVRVQDMHVYIELDQPSSVKLFTILGQPVSQAQLPAGTSRFRVSARGIYILKIGSTTRRITI